MLSKAVAAHEVDSKGLRPPPMLGQVEAGPQGTWAGDNNAAHRANNNASAATGLSPKTPSLNEVSMVPELSQGSSAGAGVSSEAMSRAKFAFLAKATNNGSLGTAAVRQKPPGAELDLRDIVSEKRNGNRRVYRQTAPSTGELGPQRPWGQRRATCSTEAFHASADNLDLVPPISTSQGTNASERLEREAVEAICKLAVANLALVHSLQAERGASAIYVASSTQMMSDKLQIYRQRTDSLLESLPQAPIEGEELEPTDYGKALENLRMGVDNRSSAYLQVMVSYSWIVDSLLDMLTQSIEPVRRTAVGPSVATLLLVQRIKECSALQRGTVSGVLASGILRVQWEVYWSLVKNLARMEAFEGVFRLLADSEVLDAFQEKASHMPPLLSEFQARLEDSKEMVEGMLITTNVEVWFRQSSEWIGLLDSIQNMVVESIQATAQRICQDEDLLLSLYQMDTSADSGSHKGAQQHHWGAADNNDDDGDSSSGDDNDGEEQHHRNQYQNQPAGKKSMDAQNSPFRKQCSIAMEDLEFGEELGRGSTGPTYMAEWQGNKVAVKVFEKGALMSDHRGHGYIRTFCQEVKTLGQLHHPNICAFYGASISLPRCCIVTEHMDRGSLWSQLHGSGDTSIDFIATAAQIASGLGYLHNIAGLVHRDMKTPNILVDHSGKVKIADFGLTIMGSEVMDEGKRVGTLRWMAPEVMQREACSFSSDVYSLGIVLWELLTKDVPFRALDIVSGSTIVRACNEGFRPVIPKGTPPSVAQLIMSCIHPEPERRPQAAEVLQALQEARRQLSEEDFEFLNAPHFSDKLVPYLSCWQMPDEPSQQPQPLDESTGQATWGDTLAQAQDIAYPGH